MINHMKTNAPAVNRKTDAAPVYVGVDVAKATLQVHRQGRQTELSNTAAPRAKLCRELKTLPSVHVVCEATGGYERDLVGALHKAKIPVSVVNPARVRAAAQALGQRAKTDRIDAAMLSDYGQRYQPQPTPPASPTQHQLVALTQWLKQLIEARAMAKIQAEHHHDPFVKKQHQALLDCYQAHIKAVEDKLQALVQKDQELQQRAETLDAIEGVGSRTALMVLAHLPELGQLNRQQVAALAAGERHHERIALHRRRPSGGPPGPLHVGPQCRAIQPSASCLLPTLDRQRQVSQSGLDRRDAQTADLHEPSTQSPDRPAPFARARQKLKKIKKKLPKSTPLLG
jgi:transposase